MDKAKIESLALLLGEYSDYRRKSRWQPIPTFLGIGAGRCGTSALFNTLDSHAEIYMSPMKEINHFGARCRTEQNLYGATRSEYLMYFAAATDEKHIGEISPIYLTQPSAAQQIKADFPNMKIIASVRCPVGRFFSQYKHHAKWHQFADFDDYVAEAVSAYGDDATSKFLSNWFHPTKNLLQSMYFQGLATYIELFGSDNVLIYEYQDLCDKPSAVMAQISDFLELSSPLSSPEVANASEKTGTLAEQMTDASLNKLLEAFADDIIKCRDELGIDTQNWLVR